PFSKVNPAPWSTCLSSNRLTISSMIRRNCNTSAYTQVTYSLFIYDTRSDMVPNRTGGFWAFQFLVCKLLNGTPKEGCNRSLTPHPSQYSNHYPFSPESRLNVKTSSCRESLDSLMQALWMSPSSQLHF